MCLWIFLGTTVLLNHNVVCSTLGRLRSTEPSRYHALSQQRGLSKKKKVNVPPDMGLEPMTLRLKVWCSTDWANRAGLHVILPSKYCVRFSSEQLVLSLDMDLKKGPMNGIFLLPSHRTTVQRCVSYEIRQFCQISGIFRANIACYVYVPDAIPYGWYLDHQSC